MALAVSCARHPQDIVQSVFLAQPVSCLTLQEMLVLASACQAWSSPTGKLRIPHIVIDESEADGIRVLARVDTSWLKSVFLIGTSMDLVQVLNHMGGMSCSDAWCVTKLHVVQEMADDDRACPCIDNDALLQRAIINCLGFLSRKHLGQAKLVLASRWYRDELYQLANKFVRMGSLVILELTLQRSTWNDVVRALQLLPCSVEGSKIVRTCRRAGSEIMVRLKKENSINES